jgi:hypothetical protein
MEYTITPAPKWGPGAIGMLLPERFRVRNAATDPQHEHEDLSCKGLKVR